ncbi:MAG TPA: archaeosortase/exosortase family protein [Myxococcota bacterium]|jgi:hypothetical protein|nr:archaeosortase/exosortase family protein [Myxococcota bacterium]
MQSPIAPVAAWLALLAAFSPVLAGVMGDFRVEGVQWGPPIAALLLGLAAMRERGSGAGRPAPRRLAGGFLLLGVALELLGLAADSAAVARAGLPLAVIGLAAWLRAPSLRVSLLALWLVPLPTTLLALTSPGLEGLWAGIAARMLRALGWAVQAGGSLLRTPQATLTLDPRDGGVPFAHLLAALGWYRSLRLGPGLGAPVRGAVCWAVWAPLLQLGATACGLALLALEGREACLFGLRDAPALVATALALTWPGPRLESGRGATEEARKTRVAGSRAAR